MITDRDLDNIEKQLIPRMKETFVTKDEFNDRIDQLTDGLSKKVEIEIEASEGRLRRLISEGHNRILTMLDGYLKKSERDDHERAALSSKVDRHDRWIHTLADKQGMRLK